jgi:hypothetical protein
MFLWSCNKKLYNCVNWTEYFLHNFLHFQTYSFIGLFSYILVEVASHTFVRNTEKSSPQEMYFTLMERKVFSWLGNNLSTSSLRPSWPKQFLPQPYTAPVTEKKIWKVCALKHVHTWKHHTEYPLNHILNKNYFMVTQQADSFLSRTP